MCSWNVERNLPISKKKKNFELIFHIGLRLGRPIFLLLKWEPTRYLSLFMDKTPVVPDASPHVDFPLSGGENLVKYLDVGHE
jgi:hypothetical protein